MSLQLVNFHVIVRKWTGGKAIKNMNMTTQGQGFTVWYPDSAKDL